MADILKSKRQEHRQMWADTEFIEKMKQAKLLKALNDKIDISIMDLTKQLARSQELDNFIKNIMNENRRMNNNLKVKYDKRNY